MANLITFVVKKENKWLMKHIPSYLVEKNQLMGTIVFTVLFSIVYLNIYSPISTTTWFELSRSLVFFLTLGFITLATVILILSRIIMYQSRLTMPLTWGGYVLWSLAEVFVITLLYTYVTCYVIEGTNYSVSEIFPKAIMVVSIVLLIPYTIAAIYGSVNYANKTLRLLNYKDAVSDSEETVKNGELINLTDNNGNVKLSIKLDNLYYIESQDNYIQVFYLSQGDVKSYMLRCKLKTIEETFADSPLIRCHRSYIINSQKIRVIKKEKDGIFIDMDHDSIKSIPVSKGYAEQVKSILNS